MAGEAGQVTHLQQHMVGPPPPPPFPITIQRPSEKRALSTPEVCSSSLGFSNSAQNSWRLGDDSTFRQSRLDMHDAPCFTMLQHN